MGTDFPAVELDSTIQLSTLSRMSEFLWHISKWAHRFSCLLQFTSGLEVLACSLNTDLDYVPTVLQLHPSSTEPLNPEPLSKVVAAFLGKMQQLFGCILKKRYVIPAALSPVHESH